MTSHCQPSHRTDTSPISRRNFTRPKSIIVKRPKLAYLANKFNGPKRVTPNDLSNYRYEEEEGQPYLVSYTKLNGIADVIHITRPIETNFMEELPAMLGSIHLAEQQ